MFMQMKSRRRYVKSEPCKCENKCPCHTPRKHSLLYEVVMCFLAAFALVGLIGGFAFLGMWYQQKHPPAIRYIEVKGQMCEVHFKETHRSATGSPRGHDEAICK